MTYTITYATEFLHDLDGSFILDRIEAYSQDDADLIMYNIEHYFHGTMIECVAEDKRKRRKPRRAKGS